MAFIEAVQRDAIEYICDVMGKNLKSLDVANQALKDILHEVEGSINDAPDLSDRASLANVYRSAADALAKIGK